jgi:16S rRNA processing protein RimM
VIEAEAEVGEPMSESSQRVVLGRIGKAHGLEGAFRLWPYADNFERFAQLRDVTLTRRGEELRVRIQSVHVHGRFLTIHTDAMATPEDVRPWLGGDLEIDESERVTPEPGEFFQDQIIGLAVVTTSGEAVGEIVRIIESPAHDVYVCLRDEKEYLIPAVDVFVKEIDVSAGRMVIAPIPGMLE